MKPDLLFYREGELRNFLGQRINALNNEVGGYEPNYILNVSEEDLCQYLISEYSLEPPEISEEGIHIANQEEVDIDVSKDPMRFARDRDRPIYIKGLQVTIAIPFNGDGELFQHRPSRFDLNPPRGVVRDQELHLIYETAEHDAEAMKQQYMNEVDRVKEYLETVKEDVGTFNKQLNSLVRQIVSQRKKKLLDDQNLVSSLGIPIRRRNDLPQTYTVPTVRKKPKIVRPKATTEPFKPEPTLAEEEYENILQIIYNMALVMERSPRTFSKLGEEEIRDHFLMHLNGHYEGRATGETFNYQGKTDILIRVEGKNIFIAECKIWRGGKGLLETIDQLLGYTSWRDTKTAILLFNRNQDFSSVLKKVGSIVEAHDCYRKEYTLKSSMLKNETTFGYVLHQPNDKNRELILTVMAFDIPS